MSALPYHKRYHSDALAGMLPLTLEERGAYNTLLDLMYDRGGPLIDNERLLAGYMNCSVRKWRQLREHLLAKGKIAITRDGEITNSRARKEIENQLKTHRKLIEAGAKGGRTRAEKEKNPNENNGTDQARLKEGSSEAQAIRALPEAKSQNQNIGLSPTTSCACEKPPPGIDTAALAFEYVCREADWRPASDTQRRTSISIIDGWLALGCSLEFILEGIAQARRRDPSPTMSLRRFDSTIRGKRRDQLGGELPVTHADVQAIAKGVTDRLRATP